MTQSDILIIGGGLTGLTLQYLLRNEAVKIIVLEARQRLGGRIHTIDAPSGASIEMGATWLGAKHTRLNSLIKELGLELYPQLLGKQAIYEWISTSPPQLVELPTNEEPSYRIRGGTSNLIQRLGEYLDNEQLFTDHAVRRIAQSEHGIEVTTQRERFVADVVVSTLPPYLLRDKIQVTPALPHELQILLEQTHTWMGESIKIGLAYKDPFWRSPNTSGTVFSNVGPVSELYDHSNYADTGFALKGFFNPSYYSLTREQRLELLLNQLRKYFGTMADSYTSYHEAIWANEKFTFVPYNTHLLPHQNNGHELYQKPYFKGKFFVAGSETSSEFPGYMEGAVRSAEFMRELILQRI